MKTKFLRIGKSSVAMVLSFLMIVSTVIVGSLGTIDASADVSVSSDGSAILFIDYRKNNDWWGNEGSTQYAHVFNNTSQDYKDLPFSKTSTTGVEYVVLPKGDWTHVILTRGGSKFSWDFNDGLYNRTKDIPLSSTGNCINNWTAYDISNYTEYGEASGYNFTSFKELKPEAEISTEESEIRVGDEVTFTASLTGDNAKFYDVKSVEYSADNATVEEDKITFNSAAGGTTATVTATITYNAKGFKNIKTTKKVETTVYVESSVNVEYVKGETTTVDSNGNTVTGVNNTFEINNNNVVTAHPENGYSVYNVSYTYVKSDDSTGTGEAKALGNNKYRISVPSDAKDGSTVTVNVQFGVRRKYTVTAYVDDTNRGSYDANYEVSVSDGQNTKITSSTANQVKLSVTEGTSVTLTITDTKINDDYIIDKWSLSGDYTLDSGSLVLSGRKSGSDSYSTHEITITPTGNVDATAYFKEDEGTAINKWIFYGDENKDQFYNWTRYAQVNKTYGGKYYAFITTSDDFKLNKGSNYFFGLSNGMNSPYEMVTARNGVTVTPETDFKPYVSMAFQKNINGNEDGYRDTTYYYAGYAIKNALVSKLRIEVVANSSGELDGMAYRLSATLTPVEDVTPEDPSKTVMVIAKDGTIRGSYSKYARMANTEVMSAEISGETHKRDTSNNTLYNNSINISAFSGLAETVNLPRGSKITFTTKITQDTELYQVRAFNVNGETVPVTSVSDNSYTGEYTIPSDDTSNKYIEITPVYFYKLDGNGKAKDKSGKEIDVITFYVENFDDKAKAAWGTPYDNNYNTDAATLSCYAWYNNNQGIDLLSADNVNKPALGGYPGQPMVYENGRYVMQVPASINGNAVKGITLNNYVWDYVHSYTFSAEGEGSRGDAKRETINCQTYDYDDFVKLSALIESDNNYNNVVVFRFKYRTDMKAAPPASSYNNRFYGNTPDADSGNNINSSNGTLKDLSYYKNGWEDYLDYYDNKIDLFNNILSDDDIAKAGDKTFKIVSDGYRDMYLGHFGVLWYIYDPNGKFIGCLPSSALFYNYTKKLENGKLPDTMPEGFVTKAFPGSDGDAAYYWNVYKTLYNGGTLGNGSHDSAVGIPAIITYETAIRAQDSNSNGHPKDPGLRNDGRWFYSKKDETINANIIIEFKTDVNLDDTHYIEDTYNTQELSTTLNPKGLVTGAQPVFTNNAAYKNKVVAKNVTVNTNDTFKFAVPKSTSTGYVYDIESQTATEKTQTYEFVGWYLKKDGIYSKINPNELAKLSGETEMISQATLVARYVPYSGDLLEITHELYKDSAYKFSESPSAHNGSGTPSVSVEVQKSDGTKTSLTVFDDTTGNSLSIDKTTLKTILYDDPGAKLVVNLNVQTEGNTDDNTVSLETIYRKRNNETTSETEVNNANGYVSFADDNSSSSKDAYGISKWKSTSSQAEESTVSDSEKKYSVTYTCDISDLFTSDDYTTLKTNIVRFYADLSSTDSTIEVLFKYYDRNDDSTSHSMPETVDIYPTTITVNKSGSVSGENALTDLIAGAAEQKGIISKPDDNNQNKYLAVNEVYSVIDEYYFWASQNQAEDGFSTLKNHHNDDEDYGKGVQYHADCYGYIYTDEKYMEEYRNDPRFEESDLEENWVTYYSFNNKAIDEETALKDPTSVNKVVVWGFNTPKDYTISFNVPKGDETDAAKAVALVKDSEDEDHPQIVGFETTTLEPFTGKYNERVGRSYDEDGIDDLSPYLKKVYGLNNSTTGKIKRDPTAEQDRNPGVTEVTYNGKTYKFDGWYYADGVKVSSDYTYANRITADTELTAGYRIADVNESKGLTVTKNATEKYFADKTSEERVRYVTQVNTYGCSDTDYNIKDIAIIYIKPYSGNSFTDSDIASIVDKVKTNNEVKELLKNTDKRETTVKTISDSDTYNGIAYAYDVVITASDGTKYDADSYDPESESNEAITKIGTTQIALTNKNRVQFALDLPLESVQTGNKNADIIVIAAMNYNDEYIASDNYIRYTAGN